MRSHLIFAGPTVAALSKTVESYAAVRKTLAEASDASMTEEASEAAAELFNDQTMTKISRRMAKKTILADAKTLHRSVHKSGSLKLEVE